MESGSWLSFSLLIFPQDQIINGRMAGEPAVLLLMEGIHLVYSTYCLFAYSELGQGVITAMVKDIESWHLSRRLMADDIVTRPGADMNILS